MVAGMVAAYGDAAQRGRWLPGLIAMTELGSYCLTEPEGMTAFREKRAPTFTHR
jgi:alkylation response protein AidB-like acyl-CoA dehydrogenase